MANAVWSWSFARLRAATTRAETQGQLYALTCGRRVLIRSSSDSLVRARTFALTAGDKTTAPSVSSPVTSGSTEKAFRSTSVPFLGVTKSDFPRTSLADELTTMLR